MLKDVPQRFENELFDCYREVERNFRERRWTASELQGGRLCEAAYSILRGYFDGNFPDSPCKPADFLTSCRKLEQASSRDYDRSRRIQIPRMLIALYEVRNNRGVGHIGGEINPNHMDAVCVLHMSKWIVSEMIRAFHDVSIDKAEKLVEGLTERHIDLIWEVDGIKRVLNSDCSSEDKTLLLLYSEIHGVNAKELCNSIEYSNYSVYKKSVLKKMHKCKLLEYDEKSDKVTISPIGVKKVECDLLVKAL